jgi:hypothetical protein
VFVGLGQLAIAAVLGGKVEITEPGFIASPSKTSLGDPIFARLLLLPRRMRRQSGSLLRSNKRRGSPTDTIN